MCANVRQRLFQMLYLCIVNGKRGQKGCLPTPKQIMLFGVRDNPYRGKTIISMTQKDYPDSTKEISPSPKGLLDCKFLIISISNSNFTKCHKSTSKQRTTTAIPLLSANTLPRLSMTASSSRQMSWPATSSSRPVSRRVILAPCSMSWAKP